MSVDFGTGTTRASFHELIELVPLLSFVALLESPKPTCLVTGQTPAMTLAFVVHSSTQQLLDIFRLISSRKHHHQSACFMVISEGSFLYQTQKIAAI